MGWHRFTRAMPSFAADPVHPTEALRVATDNLYSAFGKLPFDPSMAHEPASVTNDDLELLGQNVRTLPPALVARFVLKAGTTWGGPDDFRRIAPRALELAADQQLPIDRGLLWAKMRWAGWTEWPTQQNVTVRVFLRCEWARLLRSSPRPTHVAHRWLRYAADGLDDLAPYLSEWHVALDPSSPAPFHRAATGHLVLLLVNSPLRPDLPSTIGDVFPAHPDAAEQVKEWLADPTTSELLDRARILLADTSDARRVGVAVDRLFRFTTAMRRHRASPSPTP